MSCNFALFFKAFRPLGDDVVGGAGVEFSGSSKRNPEEAVIRHNHHNASRPHLPTLGKPPFKKSAVFLNIVQKAFDPPILFEHLSYFAGGCFLKRVFEHLIKCTYFTPKFHHQCLKSPFSCKFHVVK